MRMRRREGNKSSPMLDARRVVARQLIGSWFVNGNECSSETSGEEYGGNVGTGPASDRISQCKYFKVSEAKVADNEFLVESPGALY
jgi:hypothetical protein